MGTPLLLGNAVAVHHRCNLGHANACHHAGGKMEPGPMPTFDGIGPSLNQRSGGLCRGTFPATT